MTHCSSGLKLRRVGHSARQSRRRQAACTACLQSNQLGSAHRFSNRNQSQLQRTTRLTGAQLSKGSAWCSRISVYLRSSCSASARSLPDTATQGCRRRVVKGPVPCLARHAEQVGWRSMRSTHAARPQITEARFQGVCALGLSPILVGGAADAAQEYQPPSDKQQTGISSRMILT